MRMRFSKMGACLLILKDGNRFSNMRKSFKRLKLTQVVGMIGVRATGPGRLRRNPFVHKGLRRSA